MSQFRTRLCAALISAAVISCALSPPARADDQPAQDQKTQATQQGEAGKDEKKKIDELAEAARLLPGPAGQPECVWLGRRVVNLLYRDDLDTAFRHLDIYDRFGCPAGHIQETFRCVLRQGDIDVKSTDKLTSRVHACWINPGLPPATASNAPPGSTGQGTSNQ